MKGKSLVFSFSLFVSFVLTVSTAVATLVTYPAPPGLKTSPDFTVKVNGTSVWVECVGGGGMEDLNIANFSCDESMTITVTASANITSYIIRPKSRAIAGNVSGKDLTFTINRPQKLSIEINSLPHLAIFANPLEVNPPKNGDPGVVYYGAGSHSPGNITLQSNQTVYIAGGAVVSSTFTGSNLQNVKIIGRGIIQGRVIVSGITNLLVEGIFIRNTAHWTNCLTNCTNSGYYNVKVFGYQNESSVDGIDVVSCHNFTIADCFIRTRDDCIAIKTWDLSLNVDSITVVNNVMAGWMYNDGITLGYELCTTVQNILVKNCDILYARGWNSVGGHSGFSIVCDGPAWVQNIRYEDIRVEEQVQYKNLELIVSQGPYHYPGGPGHIKGVYMKNIHWENADKPLILSGYSADNLVEDVTFDNCYVGGKLLTKVADANFQINSNTKNIVFITSTDTSPPSSPGTIRDGTSTVADFSSTTSKTQLSANWTPSEDNESRISGYQYAIGTSDGWTQVLDWTTLGNVLTVTKTGLSLMVGTTYYFSVRAVNGAGLTGNAANSDGQVVTSVAPPYYEAEDALMSGAVITADNAGYSGAGYADYQNTSGDYIEWTVSKALAGTCKLEFRYANSATGDRPLELKVNGIVVNSSLSFPLTGSWSTWSTVSNNAVLNAGSNKVRLTSIGSNGGNIDYLNVTAIVDATPPSAPGTVRDGAVVGTDISSTTSRTQLSANWTSSADIESGISGYNYAIGSSPGATNITNWTTLGNVLTVTKAGLSLVIGTTYYFSVKAVSAGGTGTATNSNGQVVISTAIPDTTPPSAPVVRDGAVAGTDAGFTYSTTTLSANWTQAADVESGISGYNYAIGTSPGATNITNWVTIGNVLTVTKTGLTLTVGTTYYFSVKATNGQGLTGNAANSNGQYVREVNTADTTPPDAISAVRDGISETDDPYTYIATELSANWDSSADLESGISRYYFAIGTLIGATDITNWTPTGNGELTSVTQTGLTLTVGATYYFSVKAENGIGMQSTPANSDGQCVISKVAQGPVISNVQAAGITVNSAVINWETDKPSTSQVEYGFSAGYGMLTIEDGSLVTTHSMVITGLNPGQTYHYRVISKDGEDGNQSISPDYTFSTLSPPNEVAISKAYPNPCDFKNGQVIKFKVGSAGSETGEIKIYTMAGKLVRKMTTQSVVPEITWDGANDNGEKVRRGVYIYTLTSGNGDTITGKLAITR